MSLVIKTDKLFKKFNDITVLNGLDLEIAEGQVVGLIGSSGSGKTTLLRCLHNLEQATAGQVSVNGHTGLVFQHFNLFPHLSVLDNICYAPVKVHNIPRARAERAALKFLDLFDLSEKAAVYPKVLSGGQKQRVALIRGLAPKPNILLLDEPTSALDKRMTSKISDLFRRMAQEENMTLLYVSHDLDFLAQSTDRILFLHNGNILEDRKTADFFTSPNTKEAQYFLEHVDEEEYLST